mgnify:FL=1
MKKTLRHYCLVISAVCAAALSVPGQASEPLRLAVFEYPPFLSRHESGYGLEPAIVKAAFRQQDVAVEYTFLPPARALRMAKNGKFDGTLGWVHSKARAESFLYSDPFIRAPLVFFHLKELAFNWQDYDDLEGMTVGTVIDYHYGDQFHESLKTGAFKVESAPQDILNLRKLLHERIDLTPINLHVGYYLIDKHFGPETRKQFTHHPRGLKTSMHHLLLPRSQEESAERIRTFNQGLQELRESGEYQRILDRHLKHPRTQQTGSQPP